MRWTCSLFRCSVTLPSRAWQLHAWQELAVVPKLQTRPWQRSTRRAGASSVVGSVGEVLAQIAAGVKEVKRRRGEKGRFGVARDARDAGGVNLHGLLMRETYVIRATRVWALIRQVTSLLLLRGSIWHPGFVSR